MEYLEGGRFGRITKHLRKQGFEKEMEKILHDSINFPKLKKADQTEYVETVIGRMETIVGKENSTSVLFDCGAQCCGKSWSNFVKKIWDQSQSTEDFLKNLNQEEKKYHTQFTYNTKENSINVERTKCICGLINKGKPFKTYKGYCECSVGHMSVFFNTVLDVHDIKIEQSIYSGSETCRWKIFLK